LKSGGEKGKYKGEEVKLKESLCTRGKEGSEDNRGQ